MTIRMSCSRISYLVTPQLDSRITHVLLYLTKRCPGGRELSASSNVGDWGIYDVGNVSGEECRVSAREENHD